MAFTPSEVGPACKAATPTQTEHLKSSHTGAIRGRTLYTQSGSYNGAGHTYSLSSIIPCDARLYWRLLRPLHYLFSL